MDLELRRYAIKSEDWELIQDDNIFCLTRERLERGNYEYPYLVFDVDQWSGSNHAVRCEWRDGKYREIKIKVYEKQK